MPLSNFDPDAYAAMLDRKVRTVKTLLSPLSPPEPEVFASPPEAYRLRAEFRMWHDGDALDYVMFRRDDPRTPVPIHAFPIACDNIQQLMPALLDRLKTNVALRRKLFQVEFLSTLAGETLVSLIYHRRLDETWEQAARALADELGVALIGRSRKQKIMLTRDYVEEQLTIEERDYAYRQYEQAFTQPNGRVNIHMIEWACRQAAELDGDLLELYCGNGNFTLPLSRHFNRVIATELSKTSIRAARENIATNQIDNIEMIRLSAEEVTQALNGEREFRRLADLPQPLADYDLRTLFVDPPRAGLDDGTVQMAARFPRILYISCNPVTLAQNLEALDATHRVEQFGLFDQFPYTDHMECGVLLRARAD